MSGAVGRVPLHVCLIHHTCGGQAAEEAYADCELCSDSFSDLDGGDASGAFGDDFEPAGVECRPRYAEHVGPVGDIVDLCDGVWMT